MRLRILAYVVFSSFVTENVLQKKSTMIRFVSLLTVAVVAVWAAPQPYVLELDLSPEEAQKYLASPPFNFPQLAPRTAVLPLIKYNEPSFRAAEAGPTLGHYWKNGHEIENTNDYVDEVYLASQFHGQDGLGAFKYGYETPESSKIENRERSGDVTGAYTYKSGSDLINVRYWADKDGFHQEDDRPKELLEPVQETDDVRQARLAHEAAWQAAAAAAAQQPDPQGEYDYQPAGSEPEGAIVGNSAEYARQGKAYGGQSSPQGLPNYVKLVGGNAKYEEPEPTGPPRGFFYSFEYPVDIIQPKNQLPAGTLNPGKPVDHDTVAVQSNNYKF